MVQISDVIFQICTLLLVFGVALKFLKNTGNHPTTLHMLIYALTDVPS